MKNKVTCDITEFCRDNPITASRFSSDIATLNEVWKIALINNMFNFDFNVYVAINEELKDVK